jgi:hypothetical protein
MGKRRQEEMKRGFAIIEMMIIVWAASLVGYAIHRGVVEISTAPPPCERVVECGDIPVSDEAMGRR